MSSRFKREVKKEIEKERSVPNIIPAYHIVQQAKGDGFIEDYVNENLLVIQDDISQAVDNKLNYASTEVPTVFDVPGMTNSRAQMYVYFHILKALKQAEYFPRIKIIGNKSENQRVMIYVKWLSKEDVEMEKYMNKFIQAHSLEAEHKGSDGKSDLSKNTPKPISRRRRK